MSNDRVVIRSFNQAKHLRLVNRQQKFKRVRQSSYIDSYNPTIKQLIKQSLEGPIPHPLPPLSVTTISYYRRSNQPVFKTFSEQTHELQPHMTYESLWLLAGIDDIENFPNFMHVIEEFQENLNIYLNCKFKQIREMAIIAAGNKILGKPEDIERIVDRNDDQLWVLVNHIYERKINFTSLYKFLDRVDGQIIYRTIFQMSNNYKDEIIQSIMSNEDVINIILSALKHDKTIIQNYAVKIIGNILAEREEYAYDLMKFGLLDYLYPLLKSKNDELKKDVCWSISNYAFEKGSATDIICNVKFMERLIVLFLGNEKPQIKIQLYYIFCHLIERGEKRKIFEIVASEKLIDACIEDLRIEDVNLNKLTLFMILKLIDLGEDFVVEDGKKFVNIFAEQLKSSLDFRELIRKKAYSENTQITDYSFDILDKLHINQDI